MAYKLIALDLDDTLLDYDKRISPENKAAVARAKDAGLHVILASGRGYEGIEPFNRELGICDYTIAAGGAQITDSNGKVVYANYVPPIAAKQVMRWAALRNVHFQIYLDDGFYYLHANEFSDRYERTCNYKGKEDPDLLARKNILTAKILLIDTDEKIEEYRREISALFPELTVNTSQSYFLEITHPEATKGNALKHIADKLGIERGQVIAMGDSEIDFSMIEYAGLGVAVANAVPSVLDAADYVTASCEENGVAKAIEKYVLL